MTTCFLGPDPIQSTQFIPGGNTPANGGQLFFYTAGSSTKQTVYKDNAAAVAWSNPIVLDSGGNLPLGGEVWFPTGQTFKVIFAPANDTDPPASPYWTKDTLAGINDVSTQTGVEWLSGPTPTFISTTSFSVAGDQTLTFTLGRRIKTTNTGGTIYSTVTSATFAGVTTVRLVNDSGVLDSGLSAVFYSLLDPSFVSIDAYYVNRKGANVASAGNGTTNIWGIAGDYVHITGTNTIWNFSTASYAGASRDIVFDGSLVINTSASITTQSGNNISTAANDTATVKADTVSTAIITVYTSFSGTSPVSAQTSGTVFAGPVSGAAAAPTFRALTAVDGAASVLLATYTAVNTSAINVTSVLNSSYKEYELHFNDMRVTNNNVDLVMHISRDNGTTFDSTSGNYRQYAVNIGAGGVGYVSSATTGFVLTDNAANMSNISTATLTGIARLWNPLDTAAHKKCQIDTQYTNAANNMTHVNGVSVNVASSAAYNAFRLVAGAGNVSTGTMYVYGLRTS